MWKRKGVRARAGIKKFLLHFPASFPYPPTMSNQANSRQHGMIKAGIRQRPKSSQHKRNNKAKARPRSQALHAELNALRYGK